MKIKTRLDDRDLHSHVKARMLQRGVTKEEIEVTLNKGWEADDAKPGTSGKVFVFPYNDNWEGEFFEEKEVRVYYKSVGDTFVLLTVKARYGKIFLREEVRESENRI
ncbi:DUF4258 domain-containing protein [Candidatus Hakubella thermalkaliphila]|uniref:DUF4258 domain-containing protein n=1 Tax=Candidatus Hakubella thermalkaliphila TaxID=2754717 RepID=UPI0015945035|nr:DUF4258 domain-containing protein [Candidatus Hakubella thermalkaliphila]